MPLRLLAARLVLTLTAIGCAPTAGNPAPATQPSIASLSRNPVVGELGIPLGTVAEIRGTVVVGNQKGFPSGYLLQVTEVDGHPLARPVMSFTVLPWVKVGLANSSFGLYELKTGDKIGSLESAQIKELEKGYVGKHVRVAAYETGGYSGIPINLPDDVPIWQDHGWGFWTRLTVVAERR